MTISTTLAADKEKEPIVLPPEFSDFTDVFKKPKVPLPPHQPFNHKMNLMTPSSRAKQRTIH